MTKRQWVIVQQAMLMYATTARYGPYEQVNDVWHSEDGPTPSGGEIDGAMRELEELVGRPEDAK